MRFLPQTILGRMIGVVILGLIIVQAVGAYVYFREWDRFRESTEQAKLIEKVATYVQWMNAASPLQREFLLQANRSRKIRAWQSNRSHLPKHVDWFGIEAIVQENLAQALGGIDLNRIRVDDRPRKKYKKWDDDHDDDDGDDDDDHKHKKDREDHHSDDDERRNLPPWFKHGDFKQDVIALAVRLDDGVWLNMHVAFREERPSPFIPFALPLLVLTCVVLGVSVLAMRTAHKPLTRLSEAADRFGVDVNAAPMEEGKGPREVRRAARAFNRMQDRLRRFVQDRTLMLAAISHDLRTPITRMRLRAEFVEDDQQREKMLADLEEMEQMIAATMAFARDDVAHEKPVSFDLAALVESICEDRREMGQEVTFNGPEELLMRGRPIGIKRAVENLVGNAVKYGKRADVEITVLPQDIRISVYDQGDGLPETDLEEVFRPFKRGEGSRNRETGGVGLGLAVVRSVAHAHGGTVCLLNREQGGLEARLLLPKT